MPAAVAYCRAVTRRVSSDPGSPGVRRTAVEIRSVVRGVSHTHRLLRSRLTILAGATLVVDALGTVLMYACEHDNAASGFHDVGGAWFWVSAEPDRDDAGASRRERPELKPALLLLVQESSRRARCSGALRRIRGAGASPCSERCARREPRVRHEYRNRAGDRRGAAKHAATSQGVGTSS
jgi:hypothetical protein